MVRTSSTSTWSVSVLACRKKVLVASGRPVSFSATTDPPLSQGPWSTRGRKSSRCSPTAERFDTTASESTGIRVPFWIEATARTPCSVTSRSVTFPIRLPR